MNPSAAAGLYLVTVSGTNDAFTANPTPGVASAAFTLNLTLLKQFTLGLDPAAETVTEGDAGQWRDPPFSAAMRDGRIYGRGANDMKAGLVCALIALKAIVRSGVPIFARPRQKSGSSMKNWSKR